MIFTDALAILSFVMLVSCSLFQEFMEV